MTTTTLSKIGYWFILLIPIGALVGAVRGLELAGFQHTGLLWMALLAIAAFLVLAEASLNEHCRITFPRAPWLLWFGYTWASLAWCTDFGGRCFQEAVQLSMPLLIGIAASMYVDTREKLQTLLRWFAGTAVALGMVLVASLCGAIESVGLEPNLRPMGLTTALCGSVLLAGYPAARFTPWLGWSLCLGIAAFSGGRTATAAILVLPVVQPLYKSRFWRIGLVVFAMGLALYLFYLPIFQERFFYDGHGTLTDVARGDFLGFGRFAAWPEIYREAWDRPAFGAGVGSAYLFVPQVWEGMNQVHNDYLRVGFEFGLVGLALFLLVMIWQTFALIRQMGGAEGPVRTALAAALMGMYVWLLAATTDNPTGYNVWFTNPLFALIGGAYGAAAAESCAPSSTPLPAVGHSLTAESIG